MATEKNLKKLTIHKLKKKTYNALAEKPVDELVLLTDVGGQVAEITEASADYVGEIVQYVGETNDTYTNGYFYKCIETDGVYSWTKFNVQEGGGGSSLPDQTDNAGKFLTTDGTEPIWQELPLVQGSGYDNGFAIDKSSSVGNNRASASVYGTAIGISAKSLEGYGVAVGYGATALSYGGTGNAGGIAIGYKAITYRGGILLNASGTQVRNEDIDTFKIANQVGVFEMMSADGTIPTDRYTITPTTAGTYVPKLTIAEDGTATREWGTESGGGGGNVSPVFNEPIKVTVESGYLSLVDVLTVTTSERNTGNFENELKVRSFIGQKGLYLNFFLHPLEDNKSYIGNKNYRWKSVATTMLNNGEPLNVPTVGGTLARIEDINNIVKVLPTADNGYTTVKNFGNNYIEASGIYEFGALGANEEVVDVIPLPEGVQFAEGQMYWASAHVTTEDSNANAVVAHITSRTATDLTIVYKNLGTTEVENLLICWEVRGVVVPK